MVRVLPFLRSGVGNLSPCWDVWQYCTFGFRHWWYVGSFWAFLLEVYAHLPRFSNVCYRDVLWHTHWHSGKTWPWKHKTISCSRASMTVLLAMQKYCRKKVIGKISCYCLESSRTEPHWDSHFSQNFDLKNHLTQKVLPFLFHLQLVMDMMLVTMRGNLGYVYETWTGLKFQETISRPAKIFIVCIFQGILGAVVDQRGNFNFSAAKCRAEAFDE